MSIEDKAALDQKFDDIRLTSVQPMQPKSLADMHLTTFRRQNAFVDPSVAEHSLEGSLDGLELDEKVPVKSKAFEEHAMTSAAPSASSALPAAVHDPALIGPWVDKMNQGKDQAAKVKKQLMNLAQQLYKNHLPQATPHIIDLKGQVIRLTDVIEGIEYLVTFKEFKDGEDINATNLRIFRHKISNTIQKAQETLESKKGVCKANDWKIAESKESKKD